VEVGVQLPEIERQVSWGETRVMAEVAEAVGFDSLWVGDHLLYEIDGERRGPWEAWTRLAALAAVTRRVRFGPLVAALPFHPPGVLAKMAASVAEIGDGRLVLGVGAGWNRLEFEAFGLPYEHRVSRFTEAFEILHRLLAGERVTFSGDHHSVVDAEVLPRPPRPVPLMIGSNGPRMLRASLPHCAMWNTWFESYHNEPQRLGELIEGVRLACREVGRDPDGIEMSAAHLVAFDGGGTRRSSSRATDGSAPALVGALRALRSAGARHVQLVLDPISRETIERAGEALEAFRRSDG
jgi:alkanesulfonate monooxygenase SsuD/methylene tetrahydromethanopterin reductase-like flavin-dependent oxidoreductase (luciferase family)